MSEELQKQAQEKLSEARRLIREAGELAKQGQFALHFGEIGDFIPRSAVDRGLLREKALGILKAEGKENGGSYVRSETEKWDDGSVKSVFVANPPTPFDQLSEDEIECGIEHIVDGLIDEMNVPWEFREYGTADEADQWWHPSRC
jgi:hypothetical protein